MSYNTKYASKNSYRYRKNQGYYNHRAYFDDLNQFQQDREANNNYNINRVTPPEGYLEVFSDQFSGNSLDTTKWDTGIPWGTFHTDPEQQGFYFPPNGTGPNSNTIRVNNGILELDCTYDPKNYDVNNLSGRDAWRKESLLNWCVAACWRSCRRYEVRDPDRCFQWWVTLYGSNQRPSD